MRKINYLTQDELKRLLKVVKTASVRDYAIFLLSYRHGLRASEVGLVQLEDIDFSRRKFFVKRLKGSLSGEQLMWPDEVKAIKRYLKIRGEYLGPLFLSRNKNPISRGQLHYLFRKYAEKAGIPEHKRHFHTLKHSLAVHLLDAGADIMFVRELLGHKNIQNTLIYAQITSRKRDEIHSRLLLTPSLVKI